MIVDEQISCHNLHMFVCFTSRTEICTSSSQNLVTYPFICHNRCVFYVYVNYEFYKPHHSMNVRPFSPYRTRQGASKLGGCFQTL
jgi:hypothetical protein